MQAIRREAHATSADANPMRIDYGTELELPMSGEPARASEQPANAVPAPLPLPRPSASLRRPGGQAPAVAPSTSVETAVAPEPEASASGSPSRVREIVVPVKLPPGARYEVVIRLQLDTTS